jgi:hypothetical protein
VFHSLGADRGSLAVRTTVAAFAGGRMRSEDVNGMSSTAGWDLLRQITKAFESSHSQGVSTPSEARVDKKGVASGLFTGW